ncbi:GATA zinc finger domain-containing protein 15 [Fusarium oxysporum f. sp. cubense race 1]|uniref:GATA zinc finger domain-containing protein 15 n=1 Tax=Fusarium oxysporum f. sp. cubense (strain race 1) TaxID=1229664 RepID=N4U9V2_FUSC1|nr:GATA zinc finger domain-containing protein 15 [Fusarium oxysporum f. sp. cubense race 1]
MTSSVVPRKYADYHLSPNRQPLPSISEFIRDTKPATCTHTPLSSVQTDSGLSLPLASIQRTLPKTGKNPSLHQLLSASPFPPRQHNLPAVSDPLPPPFASLPSPLPVSNCCQSPSVKAEILSQHRQPQQQKTQEPRPPFRQVHSHSAPPSLPPDPIYSQPRPLPPGQIPLAPYPTPPRNGFATQAGYDASVKRHPRSWSYRDSLSQISSSSRTILNCAEKYNRIACEQHGAHVILERLPTEWELSSMLSNMELIKRSLEHIEDFVQTSIQNERASEGAKMKEENHATVSVYALQPSSGTTGTTKRLACASRTGRCQNCGRTQTPEWRRGPNGMRTLCNACGLHYAKLKYKRQIKASSIRP